MKKNVFLGLLIILLAFSFISCGDDENGDFISSTNDTTLNNVSTLGLVGTIASSSNTNVATVETPPTDKIKITSVSEGSAIITVSDGTNNATINVSVSKTGAITIGTIVKYSDNGQTGNTIVGFWEYIFPSNSAGYSRFQFNKDGTGLMHVTQVTDEGDILAPITLNIEYEIIDEKLTISYIGMDFEEEYDFELSADGNTLTIFDFEGMGNVAFTRKSSFDN